MKTALFIGLLTLTGCSTNMAAVVDAMAKDPATFCASINSVYGTARLARTNLANGSVLCTQEGMTVKSGPAQ